MTQGQSPMASGADALTDWVRKMRKELEDVREKASAMDGLEPLKLRVGAVEVEAKLMDTFVTLLTKPFEVVAKLLT